MMKIQMKMKIENHQATNDQDSIIQPAEQTPIETSKDNLDNSSDEDKIQDT